VSIFSNLRINSSVHGLARLRCLFRNGFYTYRLSRPSKRSPSHSGFPTKTLYSPLLSPILATCPIHLILDLIIALHLVSSTDHKTPRYVVFSTPLLPRSSQAQIFSSTPYSHTPSAYVPPSVCETKFHAHTKQQEKLHFCVSYRQYT